MFIFLWFHIVNSMYPLHYENGQPYVQLDSNLSPQLKIDDLLSQFLNRHNGDCPIYDAECIEEIPGPDGTTQKIRLEKESFTLYDIVSEKHDTETIIYSDKPLEEEQYNYLALGPYQSHSNSFYQNGFSLCLSESDGFITSNYNSLNLEVQSTNGVLTRLTENPFTAYGIHLQNMEISYKVHDVSSYPVYLIQEDWIVLPQNVFPEKYFKEKGFNYDSESNLYMRDHVDDNLMDIFFYNNGNQDNPLVVSPQNYINTDSGLDVLKIITMKDYSDTILLGLPFLKNKILSVQTIDNYIFVEQLKNTLCVPEDESLSGWAIFFIVLQVLLLPLLVYLTFKKLRSNQERKQQQQITSYNLHTELQHQPL